MKFRFDKDFIVDSDVEPWRREGLRIAMLGGPGSGKSWNNSLVAEQFLTQGGTDVIFQPRDEYFTLKEKFDVLSVGGVHAKDMEFALTSPSVYAKAVVEDGISMVFYTSAAQDEEKLIDWVSRFIRHVLNYQERHKRPLLLILEEAQEYAPRTASGHIAPPWVYNRMIKAFKDVFTQGRKLNIMAVASSQRPQELNFTIRQLANLTFYGNFAAQDISYIDKECLKPYRDKGIKIDANQLLALPVGRWLVIIGKKAEFKMVSQPRLTKHGAETPRLEYVVPRTTETKKTIDQLSKAVLEALRKEESEKSEVEKAKRKISDLTKKLEIAEEKARIKISVKEMLEGAPAETATEELADKFADAESQIRQLKKEKTDIEEQFKKTSKSLMEVKEKADAFENLQKALAPFLHSTSSGLNTPNTSEIDLQTTTVVLDIPDVVKHATVNTETIRGKVLKLAKNGFLDKWQGLGDVHKALIEKFGWSMSKAGLQNELNRMVKDFILGARKDRSRKQRVYKLAANVKFKENDRSF